MQLYLSRLSLDPLARQVIRDLACPYDMHRTVLRAFPGADAGGPGRVLFRLESPPAPDVPPVLLVQSDKPPDWGALDDRGPYALDVQSKAFEVHLPVGRRLRFRLRANPSVRRDGRRHGLWNDDDQVHWLKRKAELSGFDLHAAVVRAAASQVTRRPRNGAPQVHYGVLYEGLLEVRAPGLFAEAVAAGIGPAKAFGFGLLSLAPA